VIPPEASAPLNVGKQKGDGAMWKRWQGEHLPFWERTIWGTQEQQYSGPPEGCAAEHRWGVMPATSGCLSGD
jgi:hypothetical protein